MVKQFTGFITEDGSKFECEKDANKHEIAQAIRAKFPGLRSSVTEIMDNVEWFAALLSPMAPEAINHPEPVAKPPLALVSVANSVTARYVDDAVADDPLVLDPCSEGGNHHWVNQAKQGGSLDWLIDECSKCGEGRA